MSPPAQVDYREMNFAYALNLALLAGLLGGTVRGADLIVSANDAKYVRVQGVDTFRPDQPHDSLTLLDAAVFPPRVVATFAVAHAIFGPPQAVAITPNGRIAVVSAPNHYDPATGTALPDNFLQVVDLENPGVPIRRITLTAHPQGVAINRAGTLLLAATVAGKVAVVTIEGSELRLHGEISVAADRLSGVCFTPDGQAALVGLRDEQGLLVLDIHGANATSSGERIATGVGPYTVDVAGRWAVVANVGLAALRNPGKLAGDADSFTLIDISRRPFRAVQHVTVPATPEAAAISPNGRWIAVQAMNGSNLPPANPGRRAKGRVLLFENNDGEVRRTADVAGGEASQGIVFAADGEHVLVQFNVEQQIAVYAVNGGRLTDTGVRISTPGGPASLRTRPR